MGFNTFASPLKFVDMECQVLKNGVYRIRKIDDENLTYVVERISKLVIKGKSYFNDSTADRSKIVPAEGF